MTGIGWLVLGLATMLAFAGCDDGEGGGPVVDMMVDEDARVIEVPEGGAGGEGGEGGAGAMGGEGGEGGEGGMGGAGGMGGEGGGEVAPGCTGNSTFGAQFTPAALFEGAPQFTPRAVYTGTEWGVLWQQPSVDEPGLNDVRFQRVSTDGEAVGEAITLGIARLPQQEVVYNGTGFTAVWMGARGDAGGIDGIKVQLINADGTPAGPASDIPATFDVSYLSAAWAPLAGGMVVFTRPDGLYGAGIDQSGTPRAAARISEGNLQAPAVSFGDGAWGLAWLDAGVEMPQDVVFAIINDDASVISPVRRQEGVQAQGSLHIAYGASVYGVGHSRLGPMGLTPYITLYDTAGDLLASPPIPGAEGSGLVTDVSWLDPNSFGVGWQDSGRGGLQVGLSRVNTSGVVQVPSRIALPDGAEAQSLQVAGNISRAGVWFVQDPTPGPGGRFSDAAHLVHTVMGPCD